MKIIDLKQTAHSDVIDQTVKILKQGGLVIYPTETVYGAGVDATNQTAVDKLLKYKSRREGKPLSIAVSNQKMAEEYAQINQQAQEIYEQFLPGPVTVVSKALGSLAQGVASEFGTIGIRIPDYNLILDIVKNLKKPMTSTSANASGQRRPYQIKHILNNISDQQKNKIDLILDAGTLPPREPSTVIDTTLSTPLTVRSGDIKQEESSLKLTSHSEEETKQIAGKIMLKNWNHIKENGLIIALKGQLGAGKTIFAKGIAKFLKINQMITSPTYTYLMEYDYQRHQTQGNFYHLDAWKIDTEKQLKTLKVHQLIKPGNVVAVEWWSQVKEFFPHQRTKLVEVGLRVKDENQRVLTINNYDQD